MNLSLQTPGGNAVATTSTNKTMALPVIPSLLRWFLVLTTFVMVSVASAQNAANYSFATGTSGSLTDMSSGATTLVTATSATSDDASPIANIGFEFGFMGAKYTTFSAGTNGYIRLGAVISSPGGTGDYENSLSSASQVPAIAPFWEDLNNSSTFANTKIVYKVTGVAPNRVLNVQWQNMVISYNASTSTAVSTFEARLSEAGHIEFVYGNMEVASGSGTVTASIGFKSGTASGAFSSVSSLTTFAVSTSTATNTLVNTSTAGQITALSSAADGSRRTFTWTAPATPDAPLPGVSLFTATSAGSTTINWIDNSTTEYGFIITRATDAAFTQNVSIINVATTTRAATGGAYNSVQSGLVPGTTYYFKVIAAAEASASTELTGSESTTAAGEISSTATGGNWSAPATWVGGVVPTATDNVLIADGATVTIDNTSAVCNNLTIGQGTSGILNWHATAAATLTVSADVIVSANAVFAANGTGTKGLLIGSGASNGNLTVNGTFDMSPSGSTVTTTFRGSSNGALTGAGAVCNFGPVVVNKGTTIDAVLDVQRLITMTEPTASGNRLTITAGTFKLSSASQLSPYFGAQTISAAPGRLWINNATAIVKAVNAGTPLATTGNGNATVNGTLQIDAGTFAYGNGSNTFTSNGTLILGGADAVLNMYGRVGLASASVFTMTSGNFNVDPQDVATASAGDIFNINSTCTVNATGGFITIIDPNPNNATAANTEFEVGGVGTTKNFAGSTLRFGNGVSASAGNATNGGFTISLPTGMAMGTVEVNNPSGTNRGLKLSGTIGTQANMGNLTITAGSVNINGLFMIISGNCINNGVITGSTTGSRFYFLNSTAAQTYSGTGTTTSALASLDIDNPFGLTLLNTNNIITNRVNFFKGSITNSNKITLGTGSTIGVITQIGVASSTATAGSYDTYPTLDLGTGTYTVLYIEELTPRTSGFEIPASRHVDQMTINNTKGVTLAGGNVTVDTLTLTAGLFKTDAANKVVITGSTVNSISGGSATSYIQGPVARTLPASLAAGTTYNFPVGKGGYNPLQLVDATTGAGTVLVNAEVFDGNSGGTPGNMIGDISTTRYWAASLDPSTAANFTNAKIRLNDTRGIYEAIAGSSTQTGAYDMVGGVGPVLTATSITTASPATTLLGYYLMGTLDAAEISNITITPTGNLCTNVTRTITAIVTPGGAATATVVISYQVNGGTAQTVSMTNTSGNEWSGSIPVVTPSNGLVTWSIIATDANNLVATAFGGSYHDDPLAAKAVVASADKTSVCSGSPVVLTAKFENITTIGTGTLTSTSTGNSFLPGGWGGAKTQYIIRASELIAAGHVAGPITALGFEPTTSGTTYQGFSVSIGTTSLEAMTTNFVAAGLTPVYAGTQTDNGFTPVANSMNILQFGTGGTTPSFEWDGSSNIIVSICWTKVPSASTSTASSMKYIATGFTSTTYRQADSQTPAQMCGQTTGTTSGNRPIFTFYSYPVYTVEWKDAASNVVGTTNPLTVNPTANETFTATISYQGCTKNSNALSITTIALPASPSTSPSVQCGLGVPTAFAVGGLDGNYRWYLTETGGTALPGEVNNELGTYEISSTTTFYVSISDGTCESLRTPVVATVNQPDAITASSTSTDICLNSSIDLSTTQGTNNTYTFNWTASPEAGSGIPTGTSGQNVTVTPTAPGTYIYTVIGVDDDCTTSSSITVTVKGLPSIASVSATPALMCAGNTSTLAASTLVSPAQSYTVGAGALTTTGSGGSSTNYTSPFTHYYGGYKAQYVIRATELTAAGLTAGNISSLSFDVTTAGTTYNGFSVSLANTANTTASSTFVTAGLTSVYNGDLAVTSTGLKTITFSSSFTWDGTSNLLVQLCWSNNNGGGTAAEVRYDNTAYVSLAYYRNDSELPSVTCGVTSATSTVSRRPVMVFGRAAQYGAGTLSWVWNPGNLTGDTVQVSPASTTIYTVTATDPVTGCSVSESITVDINPLPAAPTASDNEHCGDLAPLASVSSNSGAPSPVFNWYADATGGTPLQSGTSTTYTTPISTTTTFYVSELNPLTGCESVRVPVTESVIEADAISAAVSPAVCLSGSLTLNVTQVVMNNTYVYEWSGTTEGGLASPVPGDMITVTPTTSGTHLYTVTGYDADKGCTVVATVTGTINPNPSDVTATAASTNVCTGSTTNLFSSAQSGVATTPYNYAEGFETFPPANWTFINAGTGNSWVSGTSARTGTKSMSYSWNSSNAANAWAISAPQTMDAGVTYSVKFWYKVAGATFPEKLKFTVGNAATVAAQTTVLWDNNGGTDLTNTTYAEATLSFTPATSGNYYFGFNCYSAANMFTLYVDDFTIDGPGAELPTYSWTSIPAGFTSTDQNPTNVQINQTTTFIVTASNSLGCSDTAQVVVNATPLPAAPTVTNSVQCGYGIPTASASGGAAGQYRWYTSATGGTAMADGQDGTLTTTTISTTTSYWVAINDGTCESLRTEVIATVNQPDAVTAGAEVYTTCINSEVVLTAQQTGTTNNYTFTWVANPVAGSGMPTSATGQTVTVNPTLQGSYTYTVTAFDATNNCTMISTSPSVLVNPIPTNVVATASTVPCVGGTVDLSASATGIPYLSYSEGFESWPPTGWTMLTVGSSNSWRPLSDLVDPPPPHSGSDAMVYLYNSFANANTWAITPGQVMEAGKTYNVKFWYNTGSLGGAYPEKLKVTVGTAATVAAQSTTLWDNNGAFDLSNEVWAEGAVTFTPTTSGTYYFGFQCYSDADNNIIIVDDVSVTETIPALTYSWASTPAGYTSTAQNPTGVVVTEPTVFTVTVTNHLGCSATGSVTVTPNLLPATPVANPSTQCGYGVPTASVSGAGGTYNWYDSPTGGSLLQTGSSNTYLSPVGSTTTFYVAEHNGTCESERVSVTVTVTPADAVTAAVDMASVCPNTTIALTATQTGTTNTYAYTWSASPLAGSGITGTETGNAVSVAPTAAGTYVYTVTAHDAALNCTAVSDVTVVVNPNPVIDSITAVPPVICNGGSSTLGVYSANVTTGPQTTPAAYCVPTQSGLAFINNVTFGTLSNPGVTQSSPYYNVYTAHTPTITRGTNVPLTVAVSESAIVSVWIDYNRDGVFSAAEWKQVYTSGVNGTTSISIPAGASLGVTGMRIRSRQTGNSNGSGDACSSFGSGTTQDYYINIVNVNTQNPDFTYLWSTGATTPTISVSPTTTTTYTVVTTNPVTGCNTTSSIQVTVSPVTATATVTDGDICVGQSTTLDATVSGGAPFTYSWSNGTTVVGTTKSLNVSPTTTTTYTVTVTDACGQSTTSSVVVNVNALPTASIAEAGPITICEPATQTLTAVTDAATASYQWLMNGNAMAGETSSTLTISQAGTASYSVIVTNTATGCVSATSAAVTVTINQQPSMVTITPSSAEICAGNSVELVASGGTVSGLVTALEENFDTNAPTWTIVNGPSSPAASNFKFVSTPYTESTGLATFSNFTTTNGGKFLYSDAEIGGSGSTTNTRITSPSFSTMNFTTATLTYETVYRDWDSDLDVDTDISTDGGTTWTTLSSFTTSQGTTTNGAQVTTNISIDLAAYLNQPNVRIRFNFVSPWGYYWLIDGVKVSGNANIPTNITWSPADGLNTTSGNTVTATPASTTTYTATSTSAQGCTNTTQVTVTVTPVPNATISYVASPYCTVAGTASVTRTGTTGGVYSASPAGLDINPATGSVTLLNSTPGTYTVTYYIAPAGGCNDFTTTTSITVTNCAPIVADPAVGGMDITDLGGTSQNSNTLAFGQTYRLLLPVYNLSQNVGMPTGATRVTIDLGTKMNVDPAYVMSSAPLSNYYSWSVATVGTHNVITGVQIMPIPADFYGTAVFNVQGTLSCTSTIVATISEYVNDEDMNNNTSSLQYTFPVTVSAVPTNLTCNGAANGTITVNASPGTTLSIRNSANVQVGTTAVTTGLPAGTYIVIATATGDAPMNNTCTNTTTVTIMEPTVLAVTTTGTDASCHGSSTGSATASASGGTAPYSYTWNTVPPQYTITATGLAAGTYTVTVTDANGCTATQTYTVNEPAASVMLATSVTNVSCFGGSNGTATVTPTGGTPGYSYLWSTGATTSSITGLAVGTYTVTVTDELGCANTASVTINQPATAVSGSISGTTGNACNGGNNGSITVAGNGGTPGYTYSITGPTVNTTGETSGVFTGLSAGNYMVYVTDANGCMSSGISASVSEPTGTTPDLSLGSDYSSNFFFANGAQNTILYNVSEIGGNPATGDTIRITKVAGYNITFDNTLTTANIGFIPYTVNNTQWKVDNSHPAFISIIKIDPSNPTGPGTVSCGQTERVAVRITRASPNVSVFTLSARLRQANGEVNLTNNLNSIVFTAE